MKHDDAELAAPFLKRARAVAPALLAAVTLGALFAPTLRWLADAWWVNSYYQHGPLVAVAAAWLAWRARERITASAPRTEGLALVAAGILLHVASQPHSMRLLSLGGLMVVLAGLALLSGGMPALRAVALPLALVALAIPLPFVARLAPPLAASVAGVAAGAAGLIGVAVAQSGPS
jgi:exosortase